ncbi:MAG TPA: hypothetical protein VKW76_06875 [Candidatus Binatia bacterium]|nr:hypothetical protein [Candidatus Binatia bacterium]
MTPERAQPEPRRPGWTWVQHLQAAVLVGALEDVGRIGSARALRLAAAAREWVASDADGHPFAFVVICGSLALEPSAVRRAVATRAPKPRTLSPRLLAWREALAEGPTPTATAPACMCL